MPSVDSDLDARRLPFFSSSSRLSGCRANCKINAEPRIFSGKSSYNNSTYSSMFRIEAFSGSVGDPISFTDDAEPCADFSRDLCSEPELPFRMMLKPLELPLLLPFSVKRIEMNNDFALRNNMLAIYPIQFDFSNKKWFVVLRPIAIYVLCRIYRPLLWLMQSDRYVDLMFSIVLCVGNSINWKKKIQMENVTLKIVFAFEM